MVGPLITGVAAAARPALGGLVRRWRREVPAGLGATLKWLVNNAEELEAAGLCPWCEGPEDPPRPKRRTSRRRSSTRFPLPSQKKKRKVSAYQKEFGRQLKKLKQKHPRTPVTRLMKRAHAATKRARRGR